ncbi:MAG TPA: tol-pal system protein YbgF [Usitatibacter sp.]|nr:tol-pal system protein YbgF [Usitatibacter sp.]
MNRATIAAGALIALAAALPSRAGLFDDDEARRRIDMLRKELAQQGNDNEARIAKLEELIRNIGVVELVRQIEQTNTEIARLRGQIEILAHENQQLQKRQRDFYLDIDSRLKRLEGNPAGTPPATPPAGDAPAAAPAPQAQRAPTKEEQAREMKAYDAASNLFRRNDFRSAIEAFRAFLKDYPESQLAVNANYWIGISYANLRDYRNALTTQQEILARHPQSAKAPDAMLAIAAIQIEQGDAGSARNTLEDIIARYPGSEAAGKARTRLAALRR